MNQNIIEYTESICPVCLKKIDAQYIADHGHVYMVKSCRVHGAFRTLVWEGEGHFQEWKRPLAHVAMADYAYPAHKGCPYDCGICQAHLQNTCCVLLEVTGRCDLNCPVCYASSAGGGDVPLEKIEGWYDMLMAKGGPYNIQLSGGEPSLRDDLHEIIAMGRQKGFEFFQLNTNGIRIGSNYGYIKRLADAGLNTVFLQFDGFSQKANQFFRGRQLVEQKVKAIENAGKAGLGIILVPTLLKGVNDQEIGDIIRFAAGHMPYVRGVHFQPMSFFGRYEGVPDGRRLTIPHILSLIEEQTGKAMAAAAFRPSGAEHTHCSFHCDFMQDEAGGWHAVGAPAQQCGCSSRQAQRVVANKWKRPAPKTGGERRPGSLDLSAMDQFIENRRRRTLAISGMAFQDAWNLDLNRLKRCYISIVSQGGKMIPFCAYNITSTEGKALYRQ